ncbi:hypothetical protein [Companilactobacillus sp. HBUAS56275]|jgi:hypothetical protein|uniref:Lipoprotein n=1 Tax=Candidatus Companilactobacillus pullicola TaxID=2838523 RepID=A0A9D2CMR2_9LACO|nr:hypothetical protein [Candidatus Companilactobacillus pullicola]
MFKRLSLFTVILSGVLLAGCSSQQATSTKSNTGSEQTEKSTKKSTPEKSEGSDQSSSTSSSSDSSNDGKQTNSDSNDTNNNSNNSGTTKSSDSTQTDQSSTSSNDSNNSSNTNNTNNSQSSQNQNSTQAQGVNITTSDQAVSFLADKLSSTYDKTTTQYVANGKVTWNNVNGYQINIYSKNSDSPVGSYLVPANGQYFQIW